MAVRQEDINSSMLSILKKMDSMLQIATDSSDRTNVILSSIESVYKTDVSVELKKQTKVLMSIDSKIDKMSNQSVGGKVNISDQGFSKTLVNVASAIFLFTRSLRLAQFFADSLPDGAAAIALSMKNLLSISKDLNLKDIAVSLAIYKAIDTKAIKDISSALAGDIFNFLGISGDAPEEAANLAKSIVILLSVAKDINKITGIQSILLIKGLAESKLIDLASALSGSFSILNLIGISKLTLSAKSISESIAIILGSSKGLSITNSLITLQFIKMLSDSKLKEYVEVLKSINLGFARFFGINILKFRSQAIAESVRILLSASSGINPAQALISILFIKELANSKLGELVSVLSKFSLFRDINKGLIKRATAISDAIKILLSTSSGIDKKTAISSIIFIKLLSGSLSAFISTLSFAGILGPLILLGAKIMSVTIKVLMSGITDAIGNGKELMQAGVYIFLISQSLGALVGFTILAGLMSPLILAGMMITKAIISVIIGIKIQMDKHKVDQDFVEKMFLLSGVVTLLVEMGVLIFEIDALKDPVGAIITLAVFLTFMGTVALGAVGISILIKKANITSKEANILGKFVLGMIGSLIAIAILPRVLGMQIDASFLQKISIFILSSLLLVTGMLLISEVTKKVSIMSIIKFVLITAVLVLTMGFVLGFSSTLTQESFIAISMFIGITAFLALSFGLIGLMQGQIKGGSIAILLMSLSLIGVASVLVAISTAPINFGQLAIFMGVTLLIAGVFFIIGLFSSNIKKAGIALGYAALSLIGLTIAIVIFSQAKFTFADIFILSLTVIAISFAFRLIGKNSGNTFKGVISMGFIALSIIVLTGALFVYSQINFGLGEGLALAAVLLGISISFFIMGKFNKEIAKGAFSLGIASIALLGLSLALLVFTTSKFTAKDALVLFSLLGGLALFFGLIGLAATPIALGAAALGLGAIAIWLMTMALKEFQTLTWKEKDSDNLTYTIKAVLGALSGTSEKKGFMANVAGGIGQGLQAILALISAGPLILGSAAIWLMSVALDRFKSVQWDSTQNVLLGDTITMVLSALAGNSGNLPKPPVTDRILDTIVAMFSAGAIIIGSAAIFLMSFALEKFRTVKWDATQNAMLGETISMVLSALRGEAPSAIGKVTPGAGILDTIVALMSAGSLIVAAASIWLLSEALIKFKTVKWTSGDTKQLSFTISEILSVMSGAEKDGGLFGAISGAAKGLLGAVGSAGNATSIGLASLSILKLSEALAKWKGLAWTNPQTDNLFYAIDKILLSFNTETGDQLDKVANNFDRIQESMKLLKEHINSMDLKKLTLTDSMMKSIALLSKSPEAIGQKIAESIDESFKKLGEAIASSLGEISSEAKGEGLIDKATSAVGSVFGGDKGKTPPAPAKPGAAPAAGGSITVAQIQTAMQAALNTATVKVKLAGPGG